MSRRGRKGLLILLAVVLLMGVSVSLWRLAALALVSVLTTMPHEDTLYRGAPVNVPPERVREREPEQTFEFAHQFTLRVYAPGNESAPLIELVDAERGALWCVCALPEDPAGNFEGVPGPLVKQIHFDRYLGTTDRGHCVLAWVEWIMGTEPSWWYIGEDGSLDSYWYDW